jgi:hypothetical protein
MINKKVLSEQLIHATHVHTVNQVEGDFNI